MRATTCILALLAIPAACYFPPQIGGARDSGFDDAAVARDGNGGTNVHGSGGTVGDGDGGASGSGGMTGGSGGDGTGGDASGGANGAGGIAGSAGGPGVGGTVGSGGAGTGGAATGGSGSGGSGSGGRVGTGGSGTGGMIGTGGRMGTGGAAPCTGCTPGQTRTENGTCGPCGTGKRSRTQTCSAACVWVGDWSTCNDKGTAPSYCSEVLFCTRMAAPECKQHACSNAEALAQCRAEAKDICGASSPSPTIVYCN